MTTVYQLGNVQIAKDMIFGWTFTYEGNLHIVENIESMEVLEELAKTNLPVYLDGFKVACRRRYDELVAIAAKEKAATDARRAEKVAVVAKAADEFKATMATIQDIGLSMVEQFCFSNEAKLSAEGSNYVYAVVTKTPGVYTGCFTISDHAGKKLQSFDTLVEVATFVARHWH